MSPGRPARSVAKCLWLALVPAILFPGATGAAEIDWGDRAEGYPAIGSNPLTNLLSPASGDLLGANDDFDFKDGTDAADALDKLADAGLDSIRRTISWQSLEMDGPVGPEGPPRLEDLVPSDDPAEDLEGDLAEVPGGEQLPLTEQEKAWYKTQYVYERALASGLTPTFILAFAPAWAAPAECVPESGPTLPCPPAPEHDGDWVKFVTTAATQFPEATFEIWNEPNSAAYWRTGPDPERWAELVSLAADAIRAVNPDARVIGCGCAGMTDGDEVVTDNTHGSDLSVREFLTRAYAAPDSIAGKLDAISFHFYPQGFQPFAPFDFGAGSHFAELVDSVRSPAKAAGEGQIPIWVNEVGYWTEDTGGLHHVVSEDQAAAGFAMLAKIARSSGQIEAIQFHRAVDSVVPASPNRWQVRQGSFGLLRRDESLSPKPSLCAIGTLAEVLDLVGLGCNSADPFETRIEDVNATDASFQSVSFTLTASPALPTTLLECSLDAAPYSFCPGAAAYSRLAPGNHSFRARAYGLLGGVDSSPATFGFTTTAPDPEPEPEPIEEIDPEPRRNDPEPEQPTEVGSKTCDIVGTDGDDVLVGTGADETICGLGGNDVIKGRGGSDMLLGGTGHDRLKGKKGRDTVKGGPGNDRLVGGKGRDLLIGGKGRDHLDGRTSRDRRRG